MNEPESSYGTLGAAATPEARLAAARAAIAMSFGVEWQRSKTASYLGAASNRLDKFAGPDAIKQAGDEVDLLSVPTDGLIEGILEPAMKRLKEVFPMNDTEHGRKYWLEVLRQARVAATEQRS